MKYKNAKTTKANCGASVKAASGGYMSVSGNGIKVDDMKEPNSGYSRGGVPKGKPKGPAPYDDSGTSPKKSPKPKKKTKSSTQGPKSGPKPKTGGTSKPTSKKAPMSYRGSGKGARRR